MDDCTFCAIGAGGDGSRTTREDVLHRDDATTAFVAAKWWRGNESHVLVIPNRHAHDVCGQDVFHFHVHVFLRWTKDGLYERNDETRWTTPVERAL